MKKYYFVFAFAVVILWEGVRWLAHEIRHRHFGGFGLFFEEFLVNEVAAGAYNGVRLKAVLCFLLSACKDGRHRKCLEFVLTRYGGSLPLEALRRSALLKLQRLVLPERYPDVALRISALLTPATTS